MPLSPGVNRRVLLSFVLAVILAGEVSGLALAGRLPARQLNIIVPVASAPAAPRSTGAPVAASTHLDPDAAVAESRIRGEFRPAAPVEPVTAAAKASPKTAPAPKPQAPAYRGRNHVWIPTLGINRSVASFPCTRSRPPDNRVYRWGCAGRNNVYLLGHAYSVFKPLHDAYVRGRLKKGMKVFYADGAGHVRTYRVSWWKVTRPTASASWAWAAQSRPSMTLQTCVGADSQYRLVVRLVAVG